MSWGIYLGVTWVSSTGEQMGGSPFSLSSCPTYGMDNSTLQSEGYIDSTGNLAPEYDAATAHLGAPWRMPTDAEFAALTNNCTATWITTNGVKGCLVTGKGDYADRSIFLPVAGYGTATRTSAAPTRRATTGRLRRIRRIRTSRGTSTSIRTTSASTSTTAANTGCPSAPCGTPTSARTARGSHQVSGLRSHVPPTRSRVSGLIVHPANPAILSQIARHAPRRAEPSARRTKRQDHFANVVVLAVANSNCQWMKRSNWELVIGIGNIGGIGNIRFARARLGRQNAFAPARPIQHSAFSIPSRPPARMRCAGPARRTPRGERRHPHPGHPLRPLRSNTRAAPEQGNPKPILSILPILQSCQNGRHAIAAPRAGVVESRRERAPP